MNYIPKIAEMLGVEVGEEFMVGFSKDETFKFERDKFMFKADYSNGWKEVMNDSVIANIIRGDLKITKKPWKPKSGESYWYVSCDGVKNRYCNNVTLDSFLFRMGNCYKTKIEAEADSEKWKQFYASDERIDWE